MKSSRVFGLGLLGLAVAAGTVSAEPVDTSQQPAGGFRRTYRVDYGPLDPTVPTVQQMLAAPQVPAGSSPTNVIYLNKCTGGCAVKIGTQDNRQDSWNGGNGAHAGTLSAYPRSATHWANVMSCVKAEFSPYNVQITDVDPGSTAHYEVMVAGDACSILPSPDCRGIGGIASISCSDFGQCSAFEPNALVFDFANSWSQSANPDNEDCSTVAQEIAHTWGLDHVIDSHDPMTYNQYNGQHTYHDAETCGSDCGYMDPDNPSLPLYSPFGEECTGSSLSTASHTCYGSGATSQDEIKTITKLFGSSAPDHTPPTITITSPAENASVAPKFLVQTTVNDNQGIERVDFSLDGGTAVSLGAFPYTWTTPANLSMGNHTVTATAYDIMGNMTTATVDVHYGDPCTNPSDCPNATDTCVSGRCIAGMGAAGGLGTACTNGGQCDSMQCASDGTQSVCVTGCDTTMNGCPSGFGCVATGTTGNAGVCFPGADGGGGGCSSSGSGGSLAFLGIGIGLAVLTFRKRA